MACDGRGARDGAGTAFAGAGEVVDVPKRRRRNEAILLVSDAGPNFWSPAPIPPPTTRPALWPSSDEIVPRMHASIRDDLLHAPRRVDVAKRVSVDDHQIGEVARLDRTRVEIERGRWIHRCGFERLVRREPRRDI